MMEYTAKCRYCGKLKKDSELKIYNVAGDFYCCNQAEFDKLNKIKRGRDGFVLNAKDSKEK